MKIILISRPRHETLMEYLFQWSQEVKDTAEKSGLKVLDCSSDKSNKDTLESFISKFKPTFILLNGHGDDSSILGHKNKPIIKVGLNEGILKNKISYARVCSSASILGPAVIKAGAKAYIGYDNDFFIVTQNDMESRPLEDDFAKPILDASNKIPISIVKGKTVVEALKDFVGESNRQIERLKSSESVPGTIQIIECLIWNRDHQKVLGDINSRI